MSALNVQAQITRKTDWNVLVTDNFRVIYDSKYEELAYEYAKFAEQSADYLKPIFTNGPDYTTILLIDNTDSANGSASVRPYPLIRAYPVLPSDFESIRNFGNWGMELIIHELTHIYNLYPATGFIGSFRYLFGSLIKPNALLPLWYHEGLAVEMETRFSDFGRLRSADYDANIRVLAASDKLNKETIDRIGETSIPSWPFGERPYFNGSILWQYLLENQPVKTADKLNQQYSRRVPFLIDGPVESLFGMDYERLLAEAYESASAKAHAQIKDIKSKKQKQWEAFNHGGTGQINPSISPDGLHMTYVSYVPKQGGELRLVSRKDLSESFSKQSYKSILKIQGTLKTSWLPDSKSFIFENYTDIERINLYRDLFQYNLQNESVVRVTNGMRASEPNVSIDGKSVVFVRQGPGRASVTVFNLVTKETTSLYTGKLQHRISAPTYLSQSSIAFVIRDDYGNQHLHTIDVNSKQLTKAKLNFDSVSNLRKTKYGLMFISNKSGAPNLYIANNSLTTATAFSNTTSKVISSEYDAFAKEIIISQLTDSGVKLFASKNLSSVIPANISRTYDGWNKAEEPESVEHSIKKEKYSALRYLVPRYWVPVIYPLEDGILFQGISSMSDPIGRHSYDINVSLDTITNEVSYGFAYTNRYWTPDISLFYVKNNEYLPSVDESIANTSTGIGTSFYLSRASKKWSAGVGAIYSESILDGTQRKKQGPTVSLSYSSSADIGPRKIKAPRYSFSLNHAQYIGDGDFLSYARTSLGFSRRWPNTFKSNHSLIYAINAAFAPDLEDSDLIQLGEKTIGGNFSASLLSSSFLLRGYPTGDFVGRSILNMNLEYQYPIKDFFFGKGTLPFFLNSIDGAVFIDGVAVDGAYVNADSLSYVAVDMGRGFLSTGAEVRISTNVGYHFPLNFIFGLYYGLDEEARGGVVPFFSIGISGIPGFGAR